MNIARLEKRDPAKNTAPVLPDLGDPAGRSQGVGPDFRALRRSPMACSDG
jgi:hypothetical protein